MLALCWTSWDDFARLGNRLTVIAVCGYAAWWYGCRAVRTDHNLGILPGWLYTLVAVLSSQLALLSSYLVVSCTPLLGWEIRTVYVGLLIWIIALQLLMQIRGTAEIEAIARKADRYRTAVEETPKGDA